MTFDTFQCNEGPQKTRARLNLRCAFVLLMAQLSVAEAQDAAEAGPLAVDTSAWQCEYCQFEQGWRSEVNLGIGYVSGDSYKFGEYNGLNESGSFLIVDADLAYRDESAAYLDLSISDLGLDTRSLLIEAGRQGGYDLYFSYDQIPHFISDSARTPYLGSGGAVLSLPGSWGYAGSTAGMATLASSLQAVDLDTERQRIGAGISINTESPWSYRVDLRSEDKNGAKASGGSFFFSSSQLVEPVDYATDEIDVAVSYTKKHWQASLGYYVSVFSNANDSLTWKSPYSLGAMGELALPPDNEFQQVSLAVAYQINSRNHLSADYAVGQMQQDERLLQATLNPLLVVPALPADSADAEIDTTNARIRFISTLTDRLRLSATVSRDERDNKTPQLLYDWVTTDVFVATQRANLPYSYTRDAFKLKADFDYVAGARLGIGYDKDERERSFQEIDKTSEDSLWGTIRLRNIDNVFLEFKLALSQRDATNYQAVAAIDPPQNLLMRKYNMADRDRQSIMAYAGFMPHPNYSVGIQIDHASDDYSSSPLGLSGSRDSSVNLDISAILSESTSVNAFAGRQLINSTQAGSQAFTTPDWIADINDTFDILGLGINYIVVKDRLDIGADLSRSLSRGEIDIDSGSSAQPFPDLTTELDSIKLYLNYHLEQNMTFRVAYWYETYDSSDWAIDGVDPATVTNLLAFGETAPSYSNEVIKLSLSYRF